jgi:hypothetical protein
VEGERVRAVVWSGYESGHALLEGPVVLRVGDFRDYSVPGGVEGVCIGGAGVAKGAD